MEDLVNTIAFVELTKHLPTVLITEIIQPYSELPSWCYCNAPVIVVIIYNTNHNCISNIWRIKCIELCSTEYRIVIERDAYAASNNLTKHLYCTCSQQYQLQVSLTDLQPFVAK